jgi:AraC family transcriptional regulator
MQWLRKITHHDHVTAENLNAHVVQIDPIPVVMLRHVGSYDGTSAAFDQLWDWLQTKQIPTERTLGIYYDDPDEVPVAQLRSAACFELAPGQEISDRRGLPIEVSEVAGGTYVTTRFVGPYEALAPVWTALTAYTTGKLGKTISSNPAFEVYVNDASDTPANELITDLFMPVH